MIIHTLKTLDNRTISSTHSASTPGRGEWITESLIREFECTEDDISEIEDGETGEQYLCVHGWPVAQLHSTYKPQY